MSEALRLAVIPGDGVGRELLPMSVEVLEDLGVAVKVELLDAGWGTFEGHGQALPAATLERARACDGIVFGAVQSPSDPVEGYASPILAMRRGLDLYANLRPVSSVPLGTSRPNVDFLVVRENTEGLYCGRERIEGDTAIAERVITRGASTRIAERAFAAARVRKAAGARGLVTVVHKANVLRLSDGLFRECALEVAARNGDIEVEEQLVDSMLYRMIREPERYDVIVAPNLYGDILSDAAAALVGGLGLVASANVGPDHILVEPVHGSAPDIAGQGIANPIATLRAIAMLLEHHGLAPAAKALRKAAVSCLEDGPRTPDLGGSATTAEVLSEIRSRIGKPTAINQESANVS
ncbi:MAG: isocitrate/isopropylmalate dehydrogenase family protein [Acidobacteriota bacterium]|nr:isocitrate/isopropylmalate dehydrogenase family protein [Acidobacteriota bacterium]